MRNEIQKQKNDSTPNDIDAQAEALVRQEQESKGAIAKTESSAVAPTQEFQAPASPQINIQQQQRAAAQGSAEYGQGESAADKAMIEKSYQFKQGYADRMNAVMPEVARDVAEFVQEGEAAVSNFFSDFATQICGE